MDQTLFKRFEKILFLNSQFKILFQINLII